MPALVLAIASILFVSILVLLAIAETLKSRAIRHKRDLAPAQAPLLSISEAFDPIYSVLWQAPIAALELIDAGSAPGVPAARLRPIYQEAASRFPEIYEGSGFVFWLQFLEETHLISWHGSNLVLTADGHALIRFRFVTDAVVAF